MSFDLRHSALHSATNLASGGSGAVTPPTGGATTPPAVPYSRPTTPGTGAFPLQIGFVGLGAMGGVMAKNLANHRANHVHASPPILVWNRTPDKAESLATELGPHKIRVAQSLEQVVTECDIIFTVLANDDVVKSIYEQFVETLKHSPPARNKIFVESSTRGLRILTRFCDVTRIILGIGVGLDSKFDRNLTEMLDGLPFLMQTQIYPTLAGKLDSLVSSVPHSHLVVAPVFGTPFVAAAAQLVIVMSGDYRSKKEVAYMLVPAVGKKVVDLGGNVEKASTFKLIGNSMILGTLEILAESYTLAEKSGIAASEVHSLVKDIFPAPGILRYSERMSTDHFDGATGFSIDGGIKDASHIRRLTAVYNSPMPSIDIAHQHLVTARAIHTSNVQAGKETVEVLDWSGIVAGTRVAAGLQPFESKNVGVVQED
ncbi:NAD-P-binding protein [Mycena vitilis]|nr:NAD-P-binding protein [Mycena vitilis]